MVDNCVYLIRMLLPVHDLLRLSLLVRLVNNVSINSDAGAGSNPQASHTAVYALKIPSHS